MTATAELAKLMNVAESDLGAFVVCLRGYLDRNPTWTLEQAIRHHQKVVDWSVANAMSLARDLSMREWAVQSVYNAHGRDRQLPA